MPERRPTAPFARGSVSVRLYSHSELDPDTLVSEFCAQAALALRVGFDGVMTGEHHGGFAGYLAQPLQMVTFILEGTSGGWVAASPLLLPLRPTALVAEEVAWLNARHRGRVGLGVAPGALRLDFDVAGVDQASAMRRYQSELPRLVAMLRGEDLGELAGDPTLSACGRDPVPVLSAAVSEAAARRAARCGAGILMEGMSSSDRLTRLTAAFDRCGGTGAKVLIRRVWLGHLPEVLVRKQRAVYESYADPKAAFGGDETIASTDPAEVVGRLGELVAETGADALNLRVQLPGMAPEVIREQIEMIGREVVGPLKETWPNR